MSYTKITTKNKQTFHSLPPGEKKKKEGKKNPCKNYFFQKI